MNRDVVTPADILARITGFRHIEPVVNRSRLLSQEGTYQSRFRGDAKGQMVLSYLRAECPDMPLNDLAYVCVGGGEGEEVEYACKAGGFRHAIMFEFMDDALKKADARFESLRQAGCKIEPIGGDVSQKIDYACSIINKWKSQGRIKGVLISAQAVIHELPTRSDPSRWHPNFLFRLFCDSDIRVFHSREPSRPPPGSHWRREVVLRLPDTEAKLLGEAARTIQDRFKDRFLGEESPASFSGAIEALNDGYVQLPGLVAIELLHKFLRYDGDDHLRHEMEECLVALDANAFSRDCLQHALSGGHCSPVRHMPSAGFDTRYRESKVVSKLANRPSELLDTPACFAVIAGWNDLRTSRFFSRTDDRNRSQDARPIQMAKRPPVNFVPRPSLFNAVKQRLLAASASENIALAAAFTGAGGFGKTTLARALCFDDRVHEAFPDGILWVTLGNMPSESHIHGELCKVFSELGGDPNKYSDSRLKDRISNCRYLVIVDDAWQRAPLDRVCEIFSGCIRLITTRNIRLATTAPENTIKVEEMEDAEAEKYLESYLCASKPRENWNKNEVQVFHSVLAKLHRWALLIELVGCYMRAQIEGNNLSLEVALRQCHRSVTRAQFEKFADPDSEEGRRAISTTIELSLKQIDHSGLQTRVSELGIFPEDTPIPLQVITDLWGVNLFEAIWILERLSWLSLIRYDAGAKEVRLHDVIRVTFRNRIENVPLTHKKLLQRWNHPLSLPYGYAWKFYAFHCVGAAEQEQLRARLLDYAWIKAKIENTSVQDLAGDFSVPLPESSAGTVGASISLIATQIQRSLTELPSQLQGRLLGYSSPRIREFREQIQETEHGVWFKSKWPSLVGPGEGLLRTIKCSEAGICALALLTENDQPLALVADWLSRFSVWNINSGAEEVPGSTLDWMVSEIVPLRDNSVLLVNVLHEIYIWPWSTGEPPIQCGNVEAESVVPLSDSSRFLIANDRELACLRILPTPTVVNKIEHLPKGFSCLAVEVQDCLVALAALDGSVKVLQCDRQWHLRHEIILPGCFGGVTEMCLFQPGPQLVIANKDGDLWHINNPIRNPVATRLGSHASGFFSVKAFNFGTQLLTGGIDGALDLWWLENTGPPRRYRLGEHKSCVSNIEIRHSEMEAVTSDYDGNLCVWDLKVNRSILPQPSHESGISAVALASGPPIAASADWTGDIKLWDLPTASLITKLPKSAARTSKLFFIDDATRLLAADDAGNVRLIGIADREVLSSHQCGFGRIYEIFYFQRTNTVACVSVNGDIQLLLLPELQLIERFSFRIQNIAASIYVPEFDRIVAIDVEGNCSCLELTGKMVSVLPRIIGLQEFTCAAYFPGKNWLCFGEKDGKLAFFDSLTMEFRGNSLKLGSQVSAIHPLSEERGVIICDWNGRVSFMRHPDQGLISEFTLDKPITCAAFDNRQLHLLVGDTVGKLHYLEAVNV